MQYGICNLGIVPVRLEPADNSEMVTQALYGDYFKVLEKRKKWRNLKATNMVPIDSSNYRWFILNNNGNFKDVLWMSHCRKWDNSGRIVQLCKFLKLFDMFKFDLIYHTKSHIHIAMLIITFKLSCHQIILIYDYSICNCFKHHIVSFLFLNN